jgi:Fic family protein
MQADPKQAEALAQAFFSLSNSVDEFRLRNYGALSAAQQQQLKDLAQVLDMRAQQCTADALAAILQGIQPHLRNIQQAIQGAQDALGRLNDVVKGLTIVDAAVALVGAVMTGDLGSVGDNLGGLVQAIQS